MGMGLQFKGSARLRVCPDHVLGTDAVLGQVLYMAPQVVPCGRCGKRLSDAVVVQLPMSKELTQAERKEKAKVKREAKAKAAE